MRSKLIVFATDFIPVIHNKAAYEKLYRKVELCEIGDWSKIHSEDSDILIIMSFDDFYDRKHEIKTLKDRLNVAFDQIERSVKGTNGNLLFAFINDLDVAPLHITNKSSNYFQFYFELMQKLNNLQNFSNFYAVDLTPYFTLENFSPIDYRNRFAISCKWSIDGLQKIFDECYHILRRQFFPRKKVIVVDCDNTLWGGVIGEDGLKSIELGTDGAGKIYQNLQSVLKQYVDDGLIIVICSKNNIEDVLDVFDNHPSMLLKKEDVAIFKVNWNEKYLNIIEAGKELGLGLDSFVFIDDNPLERQKIEILCPEVSVINLDKPLHLWPSILRRQTDLANLQDTKSDLQKTKQYQARAEFEAGKAEASDLTNYLASLKIKIRRRNVKAGDLPRAAQLCMKTNQFSTTLTRFNENDISAMLENDARYIIQIISVEDILADHGDVALTITEVTKDSYVLRAFNISCRVLGRSVEHDLLLSLLQQYGNNFEIPFVRGPRNQMVETLLDQLGEKLPTSDAAKLFDYETVYKLNLDQFNKIGIFGCAASD